MRTTIYIDDTGSPDETTNSKFSSKKSKTWTAVIMSKDERIDAEEQMKECIECLKFHYNGADEFHFTDIYQGKKKFKRINIDERFYLFEIFAGIFRDMQYPILVQTFSEEDYNRNNIDNSKSHNIDGFDLKSYNDLSLYGLLKLVKDYLGENKDKYPPPYEIIIDEGKKKNAGETQEVPSIFNKDLFEDKIFYKSSKETLLLQLADFVAYSLNRYRIILQNNKKGENDKRFLRVCRDANFNTINLVKKEISINQDTTKIYDNLQQNAYSRSGNLPRITTKKLGDELTNSING